MTGSRGTPDEGLLRGRGVFAERLAAGRESRRRVTRASLAAFPAPDRDVLELLTRSNEGRLLELIPVRTARMLVSPLSFFRGAACLMAHDLSPLPRTEIVCQICGDAHLSNFGFYASPERRILFGLNDFDETLPGPFEWDVRRLAASFAIAGRMYGLGKHAQKHLAMRACATFVNEVSKLSTMGVLAVWYQQFTAAGMVAMAGKKKVRQAEETEMKRARHSTSAALAGQDTEVVDGRLRIREEPDHIYHYPGSTRRRQEFDHVVRDFFRHYRNSLPDERRTLFDRFELVDVVVRVVGVGSVGTRCYEALLMADGQTPLFLQIKEARASALEEGLGPSAYGNHGERVVAGQHLLQGASDVFLGWARSSSGIDFYVRQLRDMKGAFDPLEIGKAALHDYADACGTALARALAKAGDAVAIRGYVGKSDAFAEAMADFAVAYADQNERDYETLQGLRKAGRIATDDR
ncbi:DUF2252 domain-containing protein [Alsobacter sp. R-9]